MKEIKLTSGATTIVDDDVYDFLSKFKWHLRRGPYDKFGYASRTLRINKKDCALMLHHHILPRLKGLEVDHIDRNSLNNCRNNLRYVTHRQNGYNRTDRV